MNFCATSRAAAFYCSLSIVPEVKAGIQLRICKAFGARSTCTIQYCRNARGMLSQLKSIYPTREKILKRFKSDFSLSKLPRVQRRQAKVWKTCGRIWGNG